MNVLVAPDSFKGSLTAWQVAEAMKKGILKAASAAEVKLVPMADGGEGTMTSLVEATDGSICEVEVEDPLGRNVMAKYGITGDGRTAVIELASASGLDRLRKEELDPCNASTYGTGQLILHALERGMRDFIICLGGSATNDGGSGILQVLGFRFLDVEGDELEPGGLSLKNLHMIDMDGVDPRIHDVSFQVACDVTNPLIGPNGASAVFGPQKGADPEVVQQLDEALKVYADCIEKEIGISVHQHPGTGAAGGTAAGLYALLNAELKPGIQLVMDAVHFEDILSEGRFDLLLTGEGKIDGQTASGKVVAGLAEAAKKYGIPVVALGGAVEGDLDPLYEKGLTAAFSITDGPMSLEDAMKNGERLIEKQAEQIVRLLYDVSKASFGSDRMDLEVIEMQYPLNGKEPKVHSSTYIAPGAHVVGDVDLQEDTSVWFNAVLRGDNDTITIGKGSNIQDGTIVHVDEGFPVKVGENVIVGHNVTLHGCTVEDGALIGMGANVLNGAVVGKGALIAAGALVPEGKEIPPGTLAAGVPAKVMRKLNDEDTKRLKQGAQHYIDNARAFKSEGIVDEK